MATEILKADSILSVAVAFFTPKKTRQSCNVFQLSTLRRGNSSRQERITCSRCGPSC